MWYRYVNYIDLELKVIVDPIFVFTYYRRGIVEGSKEGYLSKEMFG